MDQSKQSIDEIFFAALAKNAPGERSAYLDVACASDATLRQRVDRLLSAQPMVTSFLESPAPGVTAELNGTRSIVEQPGEQIGPYKLLQQIGEGGFGVVFLAEQERPVKRRVALKVIKPGMDTREVITRFEAERQALAMMDHPNIAKVHDAGATENGRPYFVMELVQGVPITEYCDQCNLTTRERLELFVVVCQAVQHAHQKGVIHRDIKPTNVLVAIQDGRPAPKIIDFGVAKAINQQLTEHTLLTAFAQIVGTPLYMSPEQAELSPLGVDTRTDIYSLGALLYELLTGTTPFDKDRLHAASYDELRRIIREEEPPRPSARISTLAADLAATVAEHRRTDVRRLRQTVHGELDWIVMKCLEKDRSRRYETPNSLARDIERYLHDEAVQACPPSVAYRLKKFIRRNKIAAAFVLLLVAAVAALAVSNVQTRRSERRATTENTKAQAVSDLLQGMLRSANPDEAKDADYTVRQLLDDFSASFGAGLADQPEVEAEIRATIGRAYWRLGAADKAEPHLTRALELRRRLFGPNHESVAEILVDTAWCRNEQQRLHEAEDAAREALRICGARGTTGSPLFQATAVLQRVLISLGRLDESRKVVDVALKLASTSREENPVVANILHNLADAEIQQGWYAQAERTARQSVEMHRRLHGAEHPETAWGLTILGAALFEQGKHSEAEAALREALSIFHKSYHVESKSIGSATEVLMQVLKARGDELGIRELTRQQLDEITSHINHEMFEARMVQGRLHTRAEQWEEAIHAYQEAIRLNPEDFAAQNNLGFVLNEQGQFKDAIDAAREALRLNPNSAIAHNNLVMALTNCPDRSLRDPQAAVKLAQRAVELAPQDGDTWRLLGISHYRNGDWQQSVQALEKSVELLGGGGSYEWFFLAMSHWQLGNKVDARTGYDKAIEWMEANEPDDQYLLQLRAEADELLGIAPPQSSAAAHFDLGFVLHEIGRFDEAIDAYKASIKLKPDRAEAHMRLGSCLRQTSQLDDAVASYRKAIELQPNLDYAYVGLALTLCEQSKFDEAEAVARKAIGLSPNNPIAYVGLGQVLHDLGKRDEAHMAWHRAIELKLNDAATFSALAWHLATAPDPMNRDATWSIKMAAKAIKFAPRNGFHWTILGVAQYRAGQWQSAIQSLERSMELTNGGSGLDWFFLAMANWQLDHKDEARKWYDKAVEWMDKNQPNNEELKRFRAEVAELLGIEEQQPKPSTNEQVTPGAASDHNPPTNDAPPTTDPKP